MWPLLDWHIKHRHVIHFTLTHILSMLTWQSPVPFYTDTCFHFTLPSTHSIVYLFASSYTDRQLVPLHWQAHAHMHTFTLKRWSLLLWQTLVPFYNDSYLLPFTLTYTCYILSLLLFATTNRPTVDQAVNVLLAIKEGHTACIGCSITITRLRYLGNTAQGLTRHTYPSLTQP